MFKGLKVLCGCILALMISVTVWASLDKNIIEGFIVVLQEPWAAATLADAYSGFLMFYAWVFYKESGWGARIGWLVAILMLGNIAMAFYVLRAIAKLPAGARVDDLLLRRPA